MNHVVCVKWGNKYISKYANVLNSMVKRHTTLPYQFHCLTDDPNGIRPRHQRDQVAQRSMDQIMVEQTVDVRTRDAFEGQHSVLSILDVVIFDNIDPLFTQPRQVQHNKRFQQVQGQGLEVI